MTSVFSRPYAQFLQLVNFNEMSIQKGKSHIFHQMTFSHDGFCSNTALYKSYNFQNNLITDKYRKLLKR